jgi:Periplasmic binding protein
MYRPNHRNTRHDHRCCGRRKRAKCGQDRHGHADDGGAGKRGPTSGRRRSPLRQATRRRRGRQADRIDRQGRRPSGENGKRLIQELIVNEKVDVIGGGPTADLLPSAPLLTEAQKPAVIMISSTTAVVEKSPYFVRTSGTLAQSSAIMADWAIRNGFGKVVTLVTEFAPGLEAEETFANNFKAAGAVRSPK